MNVDISSDDSDFGPVRTIVQINIISLFLFLIFNFIFIILDWKIYFIYACAIPELLQFSAFFCAVCKLNIVIYFILHIFSDIIERIPNFTTGNLFFYTLYTYFWWKHLPCKKELGVIVCKFKGTVFLIKIDFLLS